ncbi:hypothetical protein OH76DRAFT_668758 [Lentinus brumalis]|uniref:Uncharacterized protein n=1 Tax=Lentinus brumalis TaxID=2498619 RepID=A0A371D750_9APHY|nr:hypothetical protein OH76DRAFT_668758 [Polyporus brumalis]
MFLITLFSSKSARARPRALCESPCPPCRRWPACVRRPRRLRISMRGRLNLSLYGQLTDWCSWCAPCASCEGWGSVATATATVSARTASREHSGGVARAASVKSRSATPPFWPVPTARATNRDPLGHRHHQEPGGFPANLGSLLLRWTPGVQSPTTYVTALHALFGEDHIREPRGSASALRRCVNENKYLPCTDAFPPPSSPSSLPSWGQGPWLASTGIPFVLLILLYSYLRHGEGQSLP